MYVTRPLSLYKKSADALSLPPPEGPNSGILVIQDEDLVPTSCFGLGEFHEVKELPFPQNLNLELFYRSGISLNRTTHYHHVAFIPVLNQPLSSNKYYVINLSGKKRGEAYINSKGEDLDTFCFYNAVSDVPLHPIVINDTYQEFEIFPRRSKVTFRSGFSAKSVAPDGYPPRFLSTRWKVSASTSSDSSLGEASGVNETLRASKPEFQFSLAKKSSDSVVVGKWYCPFMFIKEGTHKTLKEEMRKSMFYEMTLEQKWEQIFSCENEYGMGNTVNVDVVVQKEVVVIAGWEAVINEMDIAEGFVWFNSVNNVGEKSSVGLSTAVVERMKSSFPFHTNTSHHCHCSLSLSLSLSLVRTQFLMGIYLSTPKTEKASEDGENDKLRFGLSSMQGWRASMEDAHAAHPYLDESTSYFGVYDGHGGKAVSKFCAKYLHQQVLKSEAYLAGDLGTSLQKSFLRMDEMMRGQRGWRELAVLGDKIEKLSGMLEGFIWSPRSSEANDRVNDWAFEEGPHSDFTGPNSGSTACVAVIRGNKLVVANAGDSRCVLSRKGQAHNLSKDHKPELEAEKDRILKAGGFIQVGRVNGSLNLARAIGDMEFKQNKYLPVEKQIVTADPDITSVELCDDDEFLVIACDGIWDCMSSQQLVDFIHQQLKTENKLSAVCEKVFDRCLAPTAGGEGCDNMTMILIQFKKPSSSPDASSVTNQPQSSAQPSEADRSSETIESK